MPVQLTDRMISAYEYAFKLHKRQLRKSSEIPYIAHLMSVSALVLECGGDEDQAIAGLLHDAVEDQGGERTLNEIQVRFGERVAEIVAGCSDSFGFPKPSWRSRKENYLAHLSTANSDILIVSLADKLHNARSILSDYRKIGRDVWKRFNGGQSGTLWYYNQLVSIFSRLLPESPLTAELSQVIESINQLDREQSQ